MSQLDTPTLTTEEEKKNLSKPRTKPEIPAESARTGAHKHTNGDTVGQYYRPVWPVRLLVTSFVFFNFLCLTVVYFSATGRAHRGFSVQALWELSYFDIF